MNKLKIAIASFLIANSFAFAEGVTDFQTKAVKELYNKGILQNIVKEEDFSKKESFSRGEIAAIIYNTVSLKNAESVKTATPEEVTILKALVSDFSSELAKLGAKDYEIIELINNQNKTINQRIDDEAAALNKKIDRINVTGDLALIKEINTNQTSANPELMQDVKGEGWIALNLNLAENVTGKIVYDLENEEGEYSLNVKKNNLTLTVFNDDNLSDEDWNNWIGKTSDNLDSDGNLRRSKDIREAIAAKKLPNFENNLGIVSKAGINNKDTIVLDNKMETSDLLALVTSTDENDIYGVQYKRQMKYFMIGEGSDSNMYLSYVGQDLKTSETAYKRFLILGADFKFPVNSQATEILKYNYVKLRQSEGYDVADTGNNYYMPIVGDEANYLYSKTTVDSKKLGKVDITFGGVNTGVNFDASSLSDSQKELFTETESQDLIKLDRNIFGGVVIVKNTKGAFENTLNSTSYKTNNGLTNDADTTVDKTTDDTTVRLDTLYSLKNGKIKLGLGVGQNTTTLYDGGTTTYTDYSRAFVEGRIQLKDVLSSNSTNLIKVKYGRESNTDKNELTAYADHKKTINNANVVLASQFEDSAEENTFKAAFYYEKTGKISSKYTGDMLFGGRYDKDYDEKTEGYRAFTKFNAHINENVSLEGGARYGKTASTTDTKANFGLGLTYRFTKDIKTSLIYGPVDTLSDYSSDIFEYKTDGIYEEEDGDQKIGSIKISCKF